MRPKRQPWLSNARLGRRRESRHRSSSTSWAPPRAGSKHLTGVLFGGVERKGRWRVPHRSLVIVGFGDANIDLRHAQIDGDVVTITAFIGFGNADFFVPEAVDVDLGGLTVFGHRG